MTTTCRLAVLLSCLLALPMLAQADDAWQEQSQRGIASHRRVTLKVVVLDSEDQPIPNATVRITQLRHHFPFGLPIDSLKRTPDKLGLTPTRDVDEFRRMFSAVSLHPKASWEKTHPKIAESHLDDIDRDVRWAANQNMTIRWGRMLSSDIGRMPGWTAMQTQEEFVDSINVYLRQIASEFGSRVQQYDLYENLITHPPLSKKLGMASTRKLFETMQAGVPKSDCYVRFENAFAEDRLDEVIKQVTALREQFVPIAGVALELHLDQNFDPVLFARKVNWFCQLKLPFVVVDVSSNALSPQQAATNLDAALRILYAKPQLKGIWFASLDLKAAAQKTQQMIDKDGQLTAAGKAAQQLIHHEWWTDRMFKADPLGRLSVEVSPGLYDLFAKLPSGRSANTSIYLAPAVQPRVTALQSEEKPAPSKADQPDEPQYIESIQP